MVCFHNHFCCGSQLNLIASKLRSDTTLSPLKHFILFCNNAGYNILFCFDLCF